MKQLVKWSRNFIIILILSVTLTVFGQGKFDFQEHDGQFQNGEYTVEEIAHGHIIECKIIFDDGCVVGFTGFTNSYETQNWRWVYKNVHGTIM